VALQGRTLIHRSKFSQVAVVFMTLQFKGNAPPPEFKMDSLKDTKHTPKSKNTIFKPGSYLFFP
jgi:hypothetical protein